MRLSISLLLLLLINRLWLSVVLTLVKSRYFTDVVGLIFLGWCYFVAISVDVIIFVVVVIWTCGIILVFILSVVVISCLIILWLITVCLVMVVVLLVIIVDVTTVLLLWVVLFRLTKIGSVRTDAETSVGDSVHKFWSRLLHFIFN
jgi:hypothetical protein